VTIVSADAPRTASEEAGGLIAIGPGPTADVIRDFSKSRREPDWMLRLRLRALERLHSDGVPAWASFLRDIDFDGMVQAEPIRQTSVVEVRESEVLPGLGALEESEAAYRAVRKELESQGVVFRGLAAALVDQPDLVKAHFAKAIAVDDHPIAALNAALWSGGSFLYVPPGVHVEIPLQAEIRSDYAKVEPFERNVIVADRGADVTYIEGCTAPVYTPDRLHVSAIEVIAMPGSQVRYIALQNFAREVDNLVTKRALVHEAAQSNGSTRTWAPAALGRFPGRISSGPGPPRNSSGLPSRGKVSTRM